MSFSPFHFPRPCFLALLLLAPLALPLQVSADTNSPGIQIQSDATNSVPAQTTESQISTNLSLELAAPAVAGAKVSSNTNSTTASDLTQPMPDIAGPMLRVFGMLAVVLGLFLGGVWLFRNWQRLTIHRGMAPKLNVLETRSLGGRHAIYVVGYENERFLISSSPAGINMLTHLQAAEENAPTGTPAVVQPSFGATLAQMLKGRQS